MKRGLALILAATSLFVVSCGEDDDFADAKKASADRPQSTTREVTRTTVRPQAAYALWANKWKPDLDLMIEKFGGLTSIDTEDPTQNIGMWAAIADASQRLLLSMDEAGPNPVSAMNIEVAQFRSAVVAFEAATREASQCYSTYGCLDPMAKALSAQKSFLTAFSAMSEKLGTL